MPTFEQIDDRGASLAEPCDSSQLPFSRFAAGQTDRHALRDSLHRGIIAE